MSDNATNIHRAVQSTTANGTTGGQSHQMSERSRWLSDKTHAANTEPSLSNGVTARNSLSIANESKSLNKLPVSMNSEPSLDSLKNGITKKTAVNTASTRNIQAVNNVTTKKNPDELLEKLRPAVDEHIRTSADGRSTSNGSSAASVHIMSRFAPRPYGTSPLITQRSPTDYILASSISPSNDASSISRRTASRRSASAGPGQDRRPMVEQSPSLTSSGNFETHEGSNFGVPNNPAMSNVKKHRSFVVTGPLTLYTTVAPTNSSAMHSNGAIVTPTNPRGVNQINSLQPEREITVLTNLSARRSLNDALLVSNQTQTLKVSPQSSVKNDTSVVSKQGLQVAATPSAGQVNVPVTRAVRSSCNTFVTTNSGLTTINGSVAAGNGFQTGACLTTNTTASSVISAKSLSASNSAPRVTVPAAANVISNVTSVKQSITSQSSGVIPVSSVFHQTQSSSSSVNTLSSASGTGLSGVNLITSPHVTDATRSANITQVALIKDASRTQKCNGSVVKAQSSRSDLINLSSNRLAKPNSATQNDDTRCETSAKSIAVPASISAVKKQSGVYESTVARRHRSASPHPAAGTRSRIPTAAAIAGEDQDDSTDDIITVDTSENSVSSALSVLLSGASSVPQGTRDIPASPRCAYRYASRSAVSNMYRQKLGTCGSDAYAKNMSQLYSGGNFFNDGLTSAGNGEDITRSSLVPNNPNVGHSLPITAGNSTTDTLKLIPGKRSSSLQTDDRLTKTPSPDPSADVSGGGGHGGGRLRCNAPHPVRRLLPSSSTPPTSESRRFEEIRHSRSLTDFIDGGSVDDDDSLEFLNAKNTIYLTKSPSLIETSGRTPTIASYIDDPCFNVYEGRGGGGGGGGEPLYYTTDTQGRSSSGGGSGTTSILRRRPPQGVLPISKQSSSAGGRRRVRFEGVSLLLSAALEGEMDIVMETINRMKDPSQPNSEGVTALHNAICGSHNDIVKYLVDYGCDVNATDDDGWTPLHCAASCNNLEAIRLLVQCGACISATTFDTNETPAQKCPRIIAGYEECVAYFAEAEQMLGVANDRQVYAVASYDAARCDELTFKTGDLIKIIRRGDKREVNWWWARSSAGKEGYVPKNLFAIYSSARNSDQKQKTTASKT